MASLVASGSFASGTGSSLNVTVTSTTAGNVMCVVCYATTTGYTLDSATDNAGTPNTYAILGPYDNASGHRLYLAYGVQVTGSATTVTLSFTGTGTRVALGHEFSWGSSWASNADAYDTSTSGSGASDAAGTVSTLTPAATGELIVAAYLKGTSGDTWSAGTNYTLASDGGATRARLEYRLTGGSSETCPISWTGATSWVGVGVAFKAPAGGGGGPTIRQALHHIKDGEVVGLQPIGSGGT